MLWLEDRVKTLLFPPHEQGGREKIEILATYSCLKQKLILAELPGAITGLSEQSLRKSFSLFALF